MKKNISKFVCCAVIVCGILGTALAEEAVLKPLDMNPDKVLLAYREALPTLNEQYGLNMFIYDATEVELAVVLYTHEPSQVLSRLRATLDSMQPDEAPDEEELIAYLLIPIERALHRVNIQNGANYTITDTTKHQLCASYAGMHEDDIYSDVLRLTRSVDLPIQHWLNAEDNNSMSIIDVDAVLAPYRQALPKLNTDYGTHLILPRRASFELATAFLNKNPDSALMSIERVLQDRSKLPTVFKEHKMNMIYILLEPARRAVERFNAETGMMLSLGDRTKYQLFAAYGEMNEEEIYQSLFKYLSQLGDEWRNPK